MAQLVQPSNNVNGMVSECGHSNDKRSEIGASTADRLFQAYYSIPLSLLA